MDPVSFELAQVKHAKAIELMRRETSVDLTEKLGHGHWSRFSQLRSIQARIACADPESLRRKTLYVACQGDQVVGSTAVTTYPPGFWKRSYWREPKALGLGVFDLVVFPQLQGQGIGRVLMNGVEELARTHSIEFVRLDAYLANPFSTAFYRRIGYEERAEIDVRTVGLILFEKGVLLPAS